MYVCCANFENLNILKPVSLSLADSKASYCNVFCEKYEEDGPKFQTALSKLLIFWHGKVTMHHGK